MNARGVVIAPGTIRFERLLPGPIERIWDYLIEPDASNATYFLAAAAISPGSAVTVTGLGRQSLQGDVGFADVLRRMGAGVTYAPNAITVTAGPDGLEGIDVDLSAMPDTVKLAAFLRQRRPV